jgi:hypothetical protein
MNEVCPHSVLGQSATSLFASFPVFRREEILALVGKLETTQKGKFPWNWQQGHVGRGSGNTDLGIAKKNEKIERQKQNMTAPTTIPRVISLLIPRRVK